MSKLLSFEHCYLQFLFVIFQSCTVEFLLTISFFILIHLRKFDLTVIEEVQSEYHYFNCLSDPEFLVLAC